MPPPPPRSTLFPYTTLFRSQQCYRRISKKNQGSVFAGIVQHKLRSTSNWHRSVLEQMSAKSEGCNSRRTANHDSVSVLLSLTGVSISNLSNSRIRAQIGRAS